MKLFFNALLFVFATTLLMPLSVIGQDARFFFIALDSKNQVFGYFNSHDILYAQVEVKNSCKDGLYPNLKPCIKFLQGNARYVVVIRESVSNNGSTRDGRRLIFVSNGAVAGAFGNILNETFDNAMKKCLSIIQKSGYCSPYIIVDQSSSTIDRYNSYGPSVLDTPLREIHNRNRGFGFAPSVFDRF